MSRVIILLFVALFFSISGISQTTDNLYTQLKKILPNAKTGNLAIYKGKYHSQDSGFIPSKYYESKIKIDSANSYLQTYIQKIKGKTNEIISALDIHFSKTEANELLLNKVIEKLKKEFEKKEKWRCTSGEDSMHAIYLPKEKLYIVVANSSDTEYILSVVNQPKAK